MKKIWKFAGPLVFAFASLVASSPALAQTLTASPLKLDVQPAAGRVNVTFKGRPVLVYAFASNQFKPYVKELDTLAGDNVLLDSPPDHAHHHGLMFALWVNGINFWEERTDPGVEKTIDQPSCEAHSVADGPARAVIVQTIHWVASTNRWLADTTPVALLVERRTLTLTINEAAGEVALRWHGDFTVGHGARQVTLSGSFYDGLGLRFPRIFDHDARQENSENLPYTKAQTGELTAARWSAVSHQLDGHDVMVAVFNRPANRGPAKFFTMLNPFTYVSATQDWEKQPQAFQTGNHFSLDYLVTVYAVPKSRAALEQRYARWLATPANDGRPKR
jgi:hypothetical protein